MFMENASQQFERLLAIMDELREKCPWDRKQTLESLRPLTIEETYELSDAILDSDLKGVKEELGDLLLHIVFYAKIGSEQKVFDIAGVISDVCDKLVRRHPHIYGDVVAEDEETVKKNWEQIKLKEGKTSVLSGVPRSLPAMVKSWRIQEKASQVGFDWDDRVQVLEKVKEEIAELEEAITAGEHAGKEDEFGDVIFALINYARFIEVDAEQALERTNRKFIRRFQWMENYALENDIVMRGMPLGELDGIWDKAKKAVG
jgi:MazG family protein